MSPQIAAEDSSQARCAGMWAIVPIKRLAAAKQRLAALLGEKREEFAYLLACRTLDVVRETGLFDGVIVVSPDARVAAAARARGALVLDDRDASLNEACALGLGAAAERIASIAVLMPADLGLLSAPALTDGGATLLRRCAQAALSWVSCAARRERALTWCCSIRRRPSAALRSGQLRPACERGGRDRS